ncbi:uncharacterized protein METZ01_LOCUS404986, partial [marine metagenome]
MKKLITLLVYFCLLIGLSINLFSQENELNYSQEDLDLAKEILDVLEKEHFNKRNFSSIKKGALELYIERLDPNKTIFLDKEVKEFLDRIKDSSQNEEEISLKLAYEIFNVFQSRYKERFA